MGAYAINPVGSFLQGAEGVSSLRDAGYRRQLAQQESQLNDQRIQGGQIALNQAGRADQAQQLTDKLISQNTTQDPATGAPKVNRGAVLDGLNQAGYGSAAANLGTQWTLQDQAQKKAQLEQQQLQLKTASEHTNYVAQHLQGVLGQPTPEAQQAAYTQSRNQMIRDGVLQPGGQDDPGETMDPNRLQTMLAQTMDQKDAIAAHQKDVENQLKAQEAVETKRNHDMENQSRAAERKIQQQNANSESTRANVEVQRFRNEQLTAPAGSAGLTGEAYLQSLDPKISNQVRAMVDGRTALPPAGSRSPQAQSLRAAAFQADPTLTDSRYVTKQSFKNKGDAQSVTQLSTAMEHLGNLQKNSADLGYAPMFGTGHVVTDSAAKYSQDMKLFTQEAGKLVANKAITQGEYEDLKKGLDSSMQSVRDNSISELTKLMGGKVAALFQKYKTGTGQDLPVGEYFDAPTQGSLVRNGIVAAPSTSAGSGFNWNDHPVAK